MLAFPGDFQVGGANMMELTQRQTIALRAPVAPANQQFRLLIALVLLLLALAVVLIKDRQFWFGSESTIVDANDYQPPVAAQRATQTPAQAPVQPETIKAAAAAAPAHELKKQVASSTSQPTPAEAPAPAVVTNRTILPPLDVEVVAGDKHRNLHPRSNTTKVQIAKPVVSAPSQPVPVAAATTPAAQPQRLAEAVQPSYPALAQHMNVQGAVVLQALIGADGRIQNLRVVSGPQILATAAQQAVREWQFKPVYQNGQPVETRATITVNFSIKVNDSSPNTSVARNNDEVIIR
jgi:TonB family protein